MIDIKNYEGLYAVTENGEVFNYKLNRFIKQQRIGNYLTVALYKDKKHKQFYVHRLVGEAFLENPNNHPVINHIDENPLNNNVSNLEWCTQQHNINYSLYKRSRKVQCIETGEIYSSINEAARQANIKVSNLCAYLKKDNSKNHILGGFHWQYADDLI